MVNIHSYKPHSNVTKETLKENNFKCIDGCYSYRFSVYKYKKETVLWCNLYVDVDNNMCSISVYDQNNNTYPAFFNRRYGCKNKVVESIDRKINSQLGTFVKNKVLKKRGKK
jgi:hypothetical protein